MAITTDYPGIKVEVRVDQVALQEYDDDEAESSTNTMSKYIEATSGSEFDIRFEITPKWPDHSVSFTSYIDGLSVQSYLVRQDRFMGASHEALIAGPTHTKNGQWFISKFAFSALKIDDSDFRSAEDQLMEDLKEMGEIKIHGFFVKNVRNSSNQEAPAVSTSDFGNIPEKALKGKALSHETTLRAPEATSELTYLTFDYVNTRREPFITFKFKYRSKAALQSLLIISRDPSPVPLEDRDVDTLTLEETRELLRRQRERGDAAPTVKRERLKRERSSTVVMEDQDNDDVSFVCAKRRRHFVALNEDGVEIVDLT
ncbi:hypothetical protein ACET3X_003936 [Alternaria dauci]|uniref:DUF7918 domain-containing protein n=1 Tax=Alternaria dauci TaxID=48095 RepID=A0ABR3UMR1_9PLEO